jgi:DNA-binding NarL/FixJ family response regulator
MKNQETIKMIIADESAAFAEALKVVLPVEEFEVTETCKEGEEVLKSLQLYRADVVLLEIKLPLLKELKVAQRLHFQFPNLVLIAITLHTEKIIVNEIFAAGCDGYVFKPEASLKLQDTIRRTIARREKIMDEVN